MRDSQELMCKFVKIVERHPEIYDSSLEAYRMREVIEQSWEVIAESVRTEMKEECTVEELKLKWRGIRSSFNRFKRNKLIQSKYESKPCKKYYLYDYLRYLDPFTKPKGVPLNEDYSDESYNESWFTVEENEAGTSNEIDEESEERDIKPDIVYENTEDSNLNIKEEIESEPNETCTHVGKKRKHDSNNVETKSKENNEDLQFFKSILPDIIEFTSKEKRKLKMGILKLIDEIEDERKVEKNNEVSSS